MTPLLSSRLGLLTVDDLLLMVMYKKGLACCLMVWCGGRLRRDIVRAVCGRAGGRLSHWGSRGKRVVAWMQLQLRTTTDPTSCRLLFEGQTSSDKQVCAVKEKATNALQRPIQRSASLA